MSTNQRPVPKQKGKKQQNKRSTNGTLYYTIGTQRISEEDEFYIDESVVKEGFNLSILHSEAELGKLVILSGEVLADYLSTGFSYIDANNASTNVSRKLKEAEAGRLEAERKAAEAEARFAELEAKTQGKSTSKAKGGSNG